MVTGIRPTADKLVKHYGLPEDLARRIAALGSAGIDLTENVLRTALDEPISALLASPRLRSAAKSLTTEKLRSIAHSLGLGGSAARLVVVPKRTRRVIAFDHEQPQAAGLPVLSPAAAPARMKPEDIQALFPADEVRRLKLFVLTSADPQERITAIRRLVLAPGPVHEKGSVLLTALTDDDPQVRLEAIKALVPLGLNPDVAREARQLVSGTDKQKTAAAGRIGGMAAEAGPGEVSVLLTLVAATLRTQIPADARRELILSLAHAAPVLVRDPAQLTGAVALLAEQLAERPLELARPVYRTLAALAAQQPDGAADALEAEVRRIPDRDARRSLLGAFSALDVSPGRRTQLAELMAEELLLAPEPETQCLGIANCLCRWGAPAADVLLRTIPRSARQQKTFILRILDSVASQRDCPTSTKTAVAETLLALLKTEPPTIRAVLLECETLSDRVLPDPLKTRIAAELIAHVHEFGGPRMTDLVEDTIARLGPPAVDPLLHLVTEGVRDRERISAARILGRIVSRLPGRGAKNSRLAVRVLMTCVKQLDKPFPDKDALAAALGHMCATKAMPPDTVRRVARGLRARVGKEHYSFGLLDGLGRLASSPNVELAIRVDVAESLLRLLEVELPEMQSKRYTGGEKTIFIAGTEAAAYTDMIPILLDGLRNVCTHTTSAALQQRLVHALLQKWREASSWRLVWGPANTLKLAEVLGDIALAPNATAETRLEIAHALATSTDLVPVLRVMGKLLAADDNSPDIGQLAAQVAQHLLDRIAPRSGDRIDLDAVVTGALAVIAARRNLGPADQADRLRTAVTGILFKALRNDAPEAKAALRRLAQSHAIGPKLHAEIQSRLEST